MPRGRVVYNKKQDLFLVYGSEQFVQDTRQKKLVQSRFRLPEENTVFKADEHYGRVPGMIDG